MTETEIALHEEIHELKKQIAELQSEISRLECENSILIPPTKELSEARREYGLTLTCSSASEFIYNTQFGYSAPTGDDEH